MVTLVGWRIATLIQIVPAVGHGIETSPRPFAYVAVFAVVFIESVALCWYTIRSRGFTSVAWSITDVGIAAAALLAEPLYIAPGEFIGTWSAWAPAFAINATVVGAVGLRRLRDVALCSVLLAGCYLAVSLPQADGTTDVSTVRSNVLTYLVFGATARVMASYVRTFADAADLARSQAVASARVAELERHRRMLHDQAGLLRLLADPSIDPALAEPLRKQALAESRRLRRVIDEDPRVWTATRTGSTRLIDVANEVVEEFYDLPITCVLDLATAVTLAPEAVEPVRSAISTSLHNIRNHAGDVTTVVLHADNIGDGWELTLRDDGRGFDLPATAQRIGLTTLLGPALTKVGVEASIETAPGEGTSITLRGRKGAS